MKNILEIYKKYKLMPSLQMHQLRVAAVASMICDNIGGLDKDSVVAACLFHDMGNIIKSNLAYFPEFLEPEGLEYWQNIKEEFVKKYGPSEHVANDAIVREIGLPDNAYSLLSAIGFSKISQDLIDDSFEKKICCYADLRVDPHGVVSIKERIEEGRKRYERLKPKGENYDKLVSNLEELEKQIFTKSSIKPEDITDESVKNIIEKLKNL